MNVVALVMIFFLMPGSSRYHTFLKFHVDWSLRIETKQRTLEELDYVFAVPTSRHASYQLNTFLPYFIQRYIFFRKRELTPLYNFDEVESVTVFEKGASH
jgi:hypothetical protein